MLHAGLGLSRKRLDVCLLTEEGEIVGEFGVPPDLDGLRGLIQRVGAVPVLGVIESMTGARFVHDRLEPSRSSAECAPTTDRTNRRSSACNVRISPLERRSVQR